MLKDGGEAERSAETILRRGVLVSVELDVSATVGAFGGPVEREYCRGVGPRGRDDSEEIEAVVSRADEDGRAILADEVERGGVLVEGEHHSLYIYYEREHV